MCYGEGRGWVGLGLREKILLRSLEMEVLIERLLGDSYLKNIFLRFKPPYRTEWERISGGVGG